MLLFGSVFFLSSDQLHLQGQLKRLSIVFAFLADATGFFPIQRKGGLGRKKNRKNQWLEDEIAFQDALFSGAIVVLGRVCGMKKNEIVVASNCYPPNNLR